MFPQCIWPSCSS